MTDKKHLIDANVFAEHLERMAKTTYPNLLPGLLEAAEYARDFLPTVDAVEVVHGHWIVKHNPITDPKGYFIRIVCSKCDLHTGQKSNYCPQCGAKMDK